MSCFDSYDIRSKEQTYESSPSKTAAVEITHHTAFTHEIRMF